MSRIFSFNELPVSFVMKMIPSLLPGIEKIISVYYSPSHHLLQASILNNTNDDQVIEMMSVSDARSVINRFRSENSPYEWLHKNDIPFEMPVKEKVQLNIFNEFENNILLIRIPCKSDNLNDLFFIHFSGTTSFGTLSYNSKGLSTESKAIIAHLIRSAIFFNLEKNSNDKILFNNLIDNQESALSENVSLQEENIKIKEKYRDGIKSLCNHHITSISLKYHREFTFSKEAEIKLYDFNEDPSGLYQMLENSCKIAELSSRDPIERIVLKDHHIILTEPKHINTEKDVENVPSVPGRYSKTLNLLNKLETAARRLKSRNEVLTSAGIGNELPVKITPPAISDALKKHRSRILHLLNEYPDRWEIIRNEFRPVRNILNARPDREQLSA